jgi:hypothetical protein
MINPSNRYQNLNTQNTLYGTTKVKRLKKTSYRHIINGILQTHFETHVTKETKLRIQNITAKEDVKCGSEAWVLKKRDEQRLETSKMKLL